MTCHFHSRLIGQNKSGDPTNHYGTKNFREEHRIFVSSSVDMIVNLFTGSGIYSVGMCIPAGQDSEPVDIEMNKQARIFPVWSLLTVCW